MSTRKCAALARDGNEYPEMQHAAWAGHYRGTTLSCRFMRSLLNPDITNLDLPPTEKVEDGKVKRNETLTACN